MAKTNFVIKLLSWRQFTVLRELHKKNMLLEDALALYKSTVVSLARRDYLLVNWEQETISLSQGGIQEMEAFLKTRIEVLKVKNTPEPRQGKFLASLSYIPSAGKKTRKG